jgi:hypothetical protein
MTSVIQFVCPGTSVRTKVNEMENQVAVCHDDSLHKRNRNVHSPDHGLL